MDRRILTCIGCPLGCTLTAEEGETGWEISGYTCKRGLDYAKKELTRPERTVTSTVRVSGGQAKVVIQSGLVTVNGELCTMRGKKLRPGDRFQFDGRQYEVCSREG